MVWIYRREISTDRILDHEILPERQQTGSRLDLHWGISLFSLFFLFLNATREVNLQAADFLVRPT